MGNFLKRNGNQYVRMGTQECLRARAMSQYAVFFPIDF